MTISTRIQLMIVITFLVCFLCDTMVITLLSVNIVASRFGANRFIAYFSWSQKARWSLPPSTNPVLLLLWCCKTMVFCDVSLQHRFPWIVANTDADLTFNMSWEQYTPCMLHQNSFAVDRCCYISRIASDLIEGEIVTRIIIANHQESLIIFLWMTDTTVTVPSTIGCFHLE